MELSNINQLFLKALYKGLLNREPDSEGFKYWDQILEDSNNFKFVFEQILNSEEYQNSHNANFAIKIDELFQNILKLIEVPINIIDIGSLDLEFDDPFWFPLGKYFDLNIIGFDPQVESRTISIEAINKTNNIIHRNFGIALGDGNIHKFYVNNEIATSSFLKIKNSLPFNHLNSLHITNEIDLKTKKLDEFKLPENIHILKIDTQGYEHEVLSNSKKVLKGTDLALVEVEFHEIYENQKLFSDIDLLLRNSNFELVDLKPKYYSYNPGSEINTEDTLVWADAIYRKSIKNLHSPIVNAAILGILFNKWNIAEMIWKNYRAYDS